MDRWYKNAAACYAFLQDVSAPHPEVDCREFKGSRWFTRGWTLQELLAPANVFFIPEIGPSSDVDGL